MPIQWTPEEVQEIFAGVDLPSGTNYDWGELVKIMGEATDVEGLTEQIVATSVLGTTSAEVLAAATLQAERQARKISGNLAKAQLQSIADKARQNLAEGNAFDKLYSKLTEIQGLDKNRAATLEKYKQQLLNQGVDGDELAGKVERMRQKLLRDRRKTIAQTEMAFAQEDGNREIAKARGAEWKLWVTAGDELVSDMDQANEAQGWIRIDEQFSSGNMQPPSHPNCRCTLAYRRFEPSADDNRRAAEYSQSTSEAKE